MSKVFKWFWDPEVSQKSVKQVAVVPIDLQIKKLYVRIQTKDVMIFKYDADIKQQMKLNNRGIATSILKKKKKEERQRVELQIKHDNLESIQFKQSGANDTLAQVSILESAAKEMTETLASIDVEDIAETKSELDEGFQTMDEVDNVLASLFDNDDDSVDLDAELNGYAKENSDEDLVFPEVSKTPIRNTGFNKVKN